MTENGSSQPPVALPGLGTAYGQTILDSSTRFLGGRAKACPCAVGRFCPIHSEGTGPNAKTGTAGTRYIPSAAAATSPHDQLAQLVATFLDGLIDQITARVVRELEPVLAEQVQLFRDLMMMQQTTLPLHICPRCSSTSCQLNELRRETFVDVYFVENSNDWAWAHWATNPCAVRVSIGERLFYVDQPIAPPKFLAYGSFVISEITNGVDNAPSCRTTDIDNIADVIQLLSEEFTFDDAIESVGLTDGIMHLNKIDEAR